MGMYSGKLPIPIGVQAYKALVRPLLEYAAEIVSLTPWPNAESLHVSMGRRLLGCWYRTSSVAVLGELGWQTMEARWQQLRVNLWHKVICMPEHAPLKRVYAAELHWYAANIDEFIPVASPREGFEIVRSSSHGRGMQLWCAQLKHDLYQLGLRHRWEQPESTAELTTAEWKTSVKTAVDTRDRARWWREVTRHASLRTFVTFHSSQQKRELASYLTVSHAGWNDRIHIGRQALTRLRCAVNELRVCTGRYCGLALEDRWCELCAEAPETEQHFLLECRQLRDERVKLFHDIDRIVNGPADASAASSAVASRFITADLPAHEQMLLIGGGGHPRIHPEFVYPQVQRVILIGIAELIALRHRLLTLARGS